MARWRSAATVDLNCIVLYRQRWRPSHRTATRCFRWSTASWRRMGRWRHEAGGILLAGESPAAVDA
jgi:hypothetical protein